MIIRDEFEEEISRQKILPSEYKSERGQTYPIFELTTSQAKQVLVRESKFVRKAIISYLEVLEENLDTENSRYLKNNNKNKENHNRGNSPYLENSNDNKEILHIGIPL